MISSGKYKLSSSMQLLRVVTLIPLVRLGLGSAFSNLQNLDLQNLRFMIAKLQYNYQLAFLLGKHSTIGWKCHLKL